MVHLTTLPSVSVEAPPLPPMGVEVWPVLSSLQPSAKHHAASAANRQPKRMPEFSPERGIGNMRNSYLAGGFWVKHSLNGLAAAASNFQDSAVGNFHAMSTESLEIAHRDGINLSWLVKLRWAASIGQLVAIGVVHQGMGIRLPLGPLLGLIALG